jgi:hypothetical protein
MKAAMSGRGAAGSTAAAGALYFALVFALCFVLGTIRTAFVERAPGAGRLLSSSAARRQRSARSTHKPATRSAWQRRWPLR